MCIASSDEERSAAEGACGEDSSSDSSCSSSSESDHRPVERPLKMVNGILPNVGKAFRHKVSKIVHFCSKSTLEDDWTFKTFSCGRSMGKI